MNKLEELIEGLCPSGVEYAPLGKVCVIGKGTQFNKSDMNKAGTYPVINGGINPSGYIEKYNQKENTITISQGGASAGYVNWIKVKFWAGAHCYVLAPMNSILNRYLFHFIKSQEYRLQECQYGAGIPALSKATVSDLIIPVPPLPVQEEIVRILDNFTELTAELTARKIQYEYYRNHLLIGNDVPQMTLKDVCNNIFSGKNKKRLDSGEYPVYGSTGIISTTDTPIYDQEQILIARVGANAGYVHIASGEYDVSDNTLIVDLKSCVLLKYIYYQLSNMNLHQYAKGGGQPLVTAGQLKEILIPVPTLEAQAKIIEILDRFYSLCNSISDGLPAEIDARQKQYEYYRDKLLSFDNVGVPS